MKTTRPLHTVAAAMLAILPLLSCQIARKDTVSHTPIPVAVEVTEKDFRKDAAETLPAFLKDIEEKPKTTLLAKAVVADGRNFHFGPDEIPEGAHRVEELAVVVAAFPGGTTYCYECDEDHTYTRLLLKQAARFDDGKIIGYGDRFPAFADEKFDLTTKLVRVKRFYAKTDKPHMVQSIEFDPKSRKMVRLSFPLDIYADAYQASPVQ